MDTTAADTRKRKLVEETERARDEAVHALNARLTVEEEAERWRLRADEAVQAQRAAEQEAEQAKRKAAEAEEQAEQARLAAEEALQTWRANLSKEAGGAAPASAVPAPPAELNATLREQVAERSAEAAAPIPYRTCSISYRREYRKVAFYALALDKDGSEVFIAASRHFRARGSGPPDRTDQAVAAHNDLVEQLAAKGWELDGEGEAWFEKTFRRRIASSVE
jgi:hypothetical protein